MEKRGLVVADSQEQADMIDNDLWSATRLFIPHGTKRDGAAERQPVYITHEEENPNGADVLLLIGKARIDGVASYEKCLLLFDGNDEAQLAQARATWKAYQSAGHEMVYWQQDERGSWKQAA